MLTTRLIATSGFQKPIPVSLLLALKSKHFATLRRRPMCGRKSSWWQRNLPRRSTPRCPSNIHTTARDQTRRWPQRRRPFSVPPHAPTGPDADATLFGVPRAAPARACTKTPRVSPVGWRSTDRMAYLGVYGSFLSIRIVPHGRRAPG